MSPTIEIGSEEQTRSSWRFSHSQASVSVVSSTRYTINLADAAVRLAKSSAA